MNINLNLKTILKSFSLSVSSFLLVAGVLYAATTIGSNIDTAGTLLVNNATSTITNLVTINATSTNATTTAFYASGLANLIGSLRVNNATSSINNLDMVNSTSTNATTTRLYASGVSNLATASSTGLVKVHQLRVGPNSTESTTVGGMSFGYCNFATNVTITGTSTDYVVCRDATGVLTSDRVFVQATSSLPVGLFVGAASSTAADTISIRLGSTGDADGSVATGLVSVNFWAVR